MLRQALIRIRLEYNTAPKRLFLGGGSLALLLTLLGIIVDSFLPFQGGSTVIRALITLALAPTLFTIGYGYSLYLRKKRKQEDPAWVSYRLRFSLTWRVRGAIIAGAFLFCFMYATGHSPAYTFLSSVYIACALALLTFTRPTSTEAKIADLGLPDPRDVQFDSQIARMKEERLQKRAQRNKTTTNDKESDE